MVHVFPSEVDQYVAYHACRVASCVCGVEHGCVTCRHHRVEITNTIRDLKWKRGHNRTNGNDGIFKRTYPQRFLPTELSRIRWNDDVIPGDAVEHLHIIQVPVDRVRIHAIVCDLPDLGTIGSY